jgi:hypothetical protein
MPELLRVLGLVFLAYFIALAKQIFKRFASNFVVVELEI